MEKIKTDDVGTTAMVVADITVDELLERIFDEFASDNTAKSTKMHYKKGTARVQRIVNTIEKFTDRRCKIVILPRE